MIKIYPIAKKFNSDEKVKAVRDGVYSYDDTPDALNIKIRVGDGLVQSISEPVQYLVVDGIADIDALRAIV